jgi:very-short-patch-repair endonuclease
MRAKSMRRKMTDAELKLWNELRAHRLMGLGFRRQFPVGGYIADFACPEKKIIVEVDGSQHAEEKQSAADAVRSAELEKDGWTVLRFWNDEILRDIDGVCHHIVIAAGLTAEDAARRAPAGALEKLA